jgi:hypothetical protein
MINLTVVNADWKEVWYNAAKRSWSITYRISALEFSNAEFGINKNHHAKDILDDASNSKNKTGTFLLKVPVFVLYNLSFVLNDYYK